MSDQVTVNAIKTRQMIATLKEHWPLAASRMESLVAENKMLKADLSNWKQKLNGCTELERLLAAREAEIDHMARVLDDALSWSGVDDDGSKTVWYTEAYSLVTRWADRKIKASNAINHTERKVTDSVGGEW